MIRRFYDKKNKSIFYKLRIYAPDGRLISEDLADEMNENKMKRIVNELDESGMIVDIFPVPHQQPK